MATGPNFPCHFLIKGNCVLILFIFTGILSEPAAAADGRRCLDLAPTRREVGAEPSEMSTSELEVAFYYGLIVTRTWYYQSIWLDKKSGVDGLDHEKLVLTGKNIFSNSRFLTRRTRFQWIHLRDYQTSRERVRFRGKFRSNNFGSCLSEILLVCVTNPHIHMSKCSFDTTNHSCEPVQI